MTKDIINKPEVDSFSTENPIDLPVPHFLEYGADIGVYSGAMTCGPCSLEMCAAYLQQRDPCFDYVKRFNALLEPERANDDYFLRHGRNTSCGEVARIASQLYGFEGIEVVGYSWERVLQELEKSAPVIVSLSYGKIPQRYDKGYTGGHFLVVCGIEGDEVICQDPDYPQDKVRYPLVDINRAAKGWSMVIGFEPLQVVEQKRQGGRWQIVFNFNLQCANPEAEIEGKTLFLPLSDQQQKLNLEVESADSRIWTGEVVLPRSLYEVEMQKPLLDLENSYFCGERPGLPLLAETIGIQLWVLDQVGNHLLVIQRIYVFNIGLVEEGGIGKRDCWESVSVRDVILEEQDNPRYRGFGFGDGIVTVYKVLDNYPEGTREVGVEYYLEKNPFYGIIEGKVIFRDKETGRGLRLVRVRERSTVPPWPEVVTPEDVEEVRRQAF